MIAVGLWGCVLALAGAFAGSVWQSHGAGAEHPAKQPALFKFRELNLPVISNGNVAGYALVKFSAVVDGGMLEKFEIKPDAFFADAVYMSLYARSERDPSQFSSADWADIAAKAKLEVNKHYGTELIQQVLIDEFGFVPAGAIRKDVSPKLKVKSPPPS